MHNYVNPSVPQTSQVALIAGFSILQCSANILTGVLLPRLPIEGSLAQVMVSAMSTLIDLVTREVAYLPQRASSFVGKRFDAAIQAIKVPGRSGLTSIGAISILAGRFGDIDNCIGLTHGLISLFQTAIC